MQRVGIVGGGQLGRMLIQAGIDLDLRIKVLDSAPDSPCAGIAHEFVLGSVREADVIERFAEGVRVLTIELEDVSVEGLERVAAKGIQVSPAPHIVALIQDKGRQRSWYAANGFPSPAYQLWNPGEPIQLPFPLIQKSLRGGYDGKGVQRVVAPAALWPVPSLLEAEVAIAKEISVIVARSFRGEMQAFPAVESVFHPEAHVVEYLQIPADIPAAVQEEAQQIAMDIAEALKVVGLLAVEFFYGTDGKLYVNEASPRPHNTGHVTVKACWVSQFEQHWRALLGLPLGVPYVHSYGGLVNILGPAGGHGHPRLVGLSTLLSIPGVSLHLYGKKRSSPFRKLGHVLVLAPSREELQARLRAVQQAFRIEVETENF
ncbi:MAG: ATP-grasp domain-containing protein [Bacteroidia bacterium]|nr:ATP-grasp domain-containing protein [Bacteroidia bacterium]GIV22998.1 MAG: N5-carboxyaminoimidazole ribonucleotide synthase [Bacteroidia bacterium]